MKYYRMIGLMGLLIFSFYLTDLVTDIAINSNSLMNVIKYRKDNYNCKSVNATIDGNTIIPGIKGKYVNEMKSYINMRDFGSFNENYLIYDYILPDVSIDNNKDKIIISGNKTNRNVSILVYNNNSIYNYLKNSYIEYTKLIKYNDNIDYKDNVNIENDKKKFLDLDTLLNKKNLNNNICIIDYSNIEACIEKEYYLVKPNIVLKNNNFNTILNNISNGSIILIDDNLELSNFKIFLKYLESKDLKSVQLNKIIKE